MKFTFREICKNIINILSIAFDTNTVPFFELGTPKPQYKEFKKAFCFVFLSTNILYVAYLFI